MSLRDVDSRNVCGYGIAEIRKGGINMKRVFFALILLGWMLPALSGCWYVAAAGAGAAAGYYAKEKGYIMQSPVTKETPKRDQDKQD